jgi:uncharacterized membrane-anchored protein
MKRAHVPTIDARYWTGITFASIFGTNMGDYYAHESGLGLLGGLPILVALFAAVYVLERFDKLSHDAYYWVCIIIMRTGATNIADFMAGHRPDPTFGIKGLGIDRWVSSAGLAVAIALLAVWAHKAHAEANGPNASKTVPDTDIRYWVCMLCAGVFGTIFGDAFEKLPTGELWAAIGLSVVLAGVLLAYRQGFMTAIYGYWLTVSTARTTGTAIGDWLAENKVLNIGLPLCTLITGAVLVAVLILLRRRGEPDAPAMA